MRYNKINQEILIFDKDPLKFHRLKVKSWNKARLNMEKNNICKCT